jgi:hypothetical protein
MYNFYDNRASPDNIIFNESSFIKNAWQVQDKKGIALFWAIPLDKWIKSTYISSKSP